MCDGGAGREWDTVKRCICACTYMHAHNELCRVFTITDRDLYFAESTPGVPAVIKHEHKHTRPS